ncbi:Mut7-C RNAse domain-containing protein [Desulfacinum hydrothermale]|nr:Mut7-C RNAse domain-containing protein [Desulfacinum hydrothermale]
MGGLSSRPRLFLVDSMLGRMAKWLRILGFDAVCRRVDTLADLEHHRAQGRLVVTRNTRWKQRPGVFFITADETPEQVRELVTELGIGPEEVRLFSRCLRCNAPLQTVPKASVAHQVPDYVYETVDLFSRCPACSGIYWRGSHSERMAKQLERMTGWMVETMTQRRT